MKKHAKYIKAAVRALLGVVFLSGWGVQSMALPPLDCEQAADLGQKKICSDALLTGLYRGLERVLAKGNDLLTDSASALVRQDLMLWMAYVERTCKEDVDCIAERFKDAIDTYSSYPEAIAGHRIFPRNYYSARKSSADSWNEFALDERIVPQVDLRPMTGDDLADVIRINAWLCQDCAEGFSRDEEDLWYNRYNTVELDVLEPGILVRIAHRHWNGHGAAHGHSRTVYSYWHLKWRRELRADDIFEGTQWPQTLGEIALALLRGRYGEANLFVKNPKELIDLVSDIERWQLGRDHLVINFAADEVLPFISYQPHVTVPWENLDHLVTNWWQEEVGGE